MPEQRVYAFADERSLIRVGQATQQVLGVAKNHYQTRLPSENRAIPTTWLAKANGFYAAGSVGSFTVLYPTGNKGSENNGDLTDLKAYVRHGLVLSGATYHLIDICDGDDAAFEVLTPDVSIIGKADAAISSIASGTVSVWSSWSGSFADSGSNVTVSNYGANSIASGGWVIANWITGQWIGGGWC